MFIENKAVLEVFYPNEAKEQLVVAEVVVSDTALVWYHVVPEKSKKIDFCSL